MWQDVVLVFVSSVVVFLTAYFILNSFFKAQHQKELLKINSESKKEIVMMRLQAYERLILLLERISPPNLVMRLNKEAVIAHDFYNLMVSTLRSEFDHNIAQQLYVSNELWGKVLKARDEIATVINKSNSIVDGNLPSIELIKKVLELGSQLKAVEEAIIFLKKEVAGLF